MFVSNHCPHTAMGAFRWHSFEQYIHEGAVLPLPMAGFKPKSFCPKSSGELMLVPKQFYRLSCYSVVVYFFFCVPLWSDVNYTAD